MWLLGLGWLAGLPLIGQGCAGGASEEPLGDGGTDVGVLGHHDAGMPSESDGEADSARDGTMSIELGGDTGSPPDGTTTGDTSQPPEGSTSSEAGAPDGTLGGEDGSFGDSPSANDSSMRMDGARSDDGAARESGVQTDGGGAHDAGVDAGACDPVKQTGCPGTDECTLGNGNAPVCAPNGTRKVGEICGSLVTDTCIAGNLCSTDSANGVYTCQQFCVVEADCKQPAFGPAKNTAHCIIGLEGTSEMLCTVPCNPVTAAGTSGCQAGQACSYGGTDTIPEVTSCDTGGAGVDGTSCTGAQDCADGFTCITGGGGTSACRQVCRAHTNSDCNKTGYVCGLLPDATMYGICCAAAGC